MSELKTEPNEVPVKGQGEKKKKGLSPLLQEVELPSHRDLAAIYTQPTVLGKPCPPATIQEAVYLAKSIFACGAFREFIKSEHEALMKIQAGRELGIGPVASITAFYVLNRDTGSGRVEMSAQLMAGLVKSSEDYDYEIEHIDDNSCTLRWYYGKPDNPKRKLLGSSTFTLDEAKKAGLYRPGGAWQKWTSDMLFARSLSRGFRRFTPHLSYGIAPYVQGEVSGDVEEAEYFVKPNQLDQLMEETVSE